MSNEKWGRAVAVAFALGCAVAGAGAQSVNQGPVMADLIAAVREVGQTSWTAEWGVWIAAGALVVAFFQLVLFWWQLRQMRRSLKDADRAATAAEGALEQMRVASERQLRAYVVLEKAVITFPQPGVPLVHIVMRNSGQTPAFGLQWWITAMPRPYDESVVFEDNPNWSEVTATVLAAGAESIHTFQGPHAITRPGFEHKIGTPECTLFVWGAARYKDVMGIERVTTYRVMYGGSESREGSPNGALRACRGGNSVT